MEIKNHGDAIKGLKKLLSTEEIIEDAFYSDYDLFLMSYDVVCITLELSSIDAPPTVLCVLFVLFITSFFAAIRQHADYDFISASFNLMCLSL